jgi:hypothetical protein
MLKRRWARAALERAGAVHLSPRRCEELLRDEAIHLSANDAGATDARCGYIAIGENLRIKFLSARSAQNSVLPADRFRIASSRVVLRTHFHDERSSQ